MKTLILHYLLVKLTLSLFEILCQYRKSKNKSYRNEVAATYQKRFNDKNQKLDFKLTYSNFRSNFDQFNNFTQPLISYQEGFNGSKQNFYNFRVDYSQPIKLLEEGKISFGGLYEKVDFTTDNLGIKILITKDKQLPPMLRLMQN